jgi:pseudouridine-5'-phosphate glycosidase
MAVESAVRDGGAVPATIAVANGKLQVGLLASEIEELGRIGREAVKCSRRDLPFVIARKLRGATTVAATMIIAARAGIKVFATGGIGGVHRGVEDTLDISADLEELGRTDVIVVCAGVKSILDIPRTLEYLETKGVPVIGYQTSQLPAFYARSSGCSVDYRVENAAELAGAILAKQQLGLGGGMLVGVPIPAEHALDSDTIDAVIAEAIEAMEQRGIHGKETTPYLLASIAERTGGKSLEANIQLILNNARVAADLAVSLCQSSI